MTEREWRLLLCLVASFGLTGLLALALYWVPELRSQWLAWPRPVSRTGEQPAHSRVGRGG